MQNPWFSCFSRGWLIDFSNYLLFSLCDISNLFVNTGKFIFTFFFFILTKKVHDEREMDRVLAIDGVNLIGINNRNLGMLSLTNVVFVPNIFHRYIFFISFGI